MKILLVSTKFPYPPKDGGAIATLTLAKGYALSGHMVTVLCMNTPKHFYDPALLPADLSSTVKFIPVPVDTGIYPSKLVKNFIFSSLPYNAEQFYSLAFEKKLTEVIKTGDFDIIQLEGIYLVYFAEKIRKLSAAKIILRAPNIEHDIWKTLAVHEKNFLRKLYLRNFSLRVRSLEDRLMNHYDAIVPITLEDAKIFSLMGNKKPMHIAPFGINTNHLDNVTKANPSSLFFIGALDWMPNLSGLEWFLKEVWKKKILKTGQSELKFYVAGRNTPVWLKRKYEDERTVFAGEVNDAAKFMEDKGIMVVPLFSGSGMRIKIIEGMAHGKAIISTSLGASGIDYKKGKQILIADTPDGFTKYIHDLAYDPLRQQQMGENAADFVRENFDAQSIVHSLLNFYETIKVKV